MSENKIKKGKFICLAIVFKIGDYIWRFLQKKNNDKNYLDDLGFRLSGL